MHIYICWPIIHIVNKRFKISCLIVTEIIENSLTKKSAPPVHQPKNGMLEERGNTDFSEFCEQTNYQPCPFSSTARSCYYPINNTSVQGNRVDNHRNVSSKQELSNSDLEIGVKDQLSRSSSSRLEKLVKSSQLEILHSSKNL